MTTTKFYNQPETLESANLIKQQILALGSALFFTENESLLKLPVHVINNVQVDDQNRIWFLIQGLLRRLLSLTRELPAKLDFFKKGISYYIKIKGTASIVENAAKVNALSGDDGDNKDLVAICVKVRTIDYFDTGVKPSLSWLQQSKQQLSSLFS